MRRNICVVELKIVELIGSRSGQMYLFVVRTLFLSEAVNICISECDVDELMLGTIYLFLI